MHHASNLANPTPLFDTGCYAGCLSWWQVSFRAFCRAFLQPTTAGKGRFRPCWLRLANAPQGA
eukprot:2870782-Lingulodinium_polyedra.AAC.1